MEYVKVDSQAKLDEARLRELADELRVSWSDRGWVAAKKITGLLAEAREAATGIDTLLDALSAERERGDRAEWRPISEAPRDTDISRPILVVTVDGTDTPDYDVVHEGWTNTDGSPVWFTGDVAVEPTHFRPLPSPPLATQKAEEAET